jgi:hypothetical protein
MLAKAIFCGNMQPFDMQPFDRTRARVRLGA